jgi:hypothetical protein
VSAVQFFLQVLYVLVFGGDLCVRVSELGFFFGNGQGQSFLLREEVVIEVFGNGDGGFARSVCGGGFPEDKQADQQRDNCDQQEK